MDSPTCVGALIRDAANRVYVQRRTADRKLLPGIWDIVGGHLEAGETPEAALARELEEETGWTLRRVEAVLADWVWAAGGVARRELDYLVEVDGDLATPRLEPGKHDASAWVGPDNLELLMEGRTDGDRRLRDIVAKAVRTRLTDRLRLEPLGPEHTEDLRRLHADAGVAAWNGGRWATQTARAYAVATRAGWETDGAHKWIAYDRVTGELVGRGGLSLRRVDGQEQPEVGWAVRSDRWGQGYATEIGRAGLAFAFGDLGAEEVVAFTEQHNRRSRAVMERLGMRYVHDFTRPGLIEGRDGIHDDATFVLYSVRRPDGRP